MTPPLTTPLHRRDIDFNMGAPIPIHWLGGDCHRTRFFDAMSIMFPEGERAFIESVHHYRTHIGVDAELAYEVEEFIAQEALHSREHVRYNRRLQAQGAPIKKLAGIVAAQQAFARRHLPPFMRLAITVCLEHFTALFADQILRDPRSLERAHPAMSDIWHWHALEETEHKAVAFDVLTAVVRGPLRRYLLRCVTMLLVSTIFSTLLWRLTFQLVRHDRRATDIRGWLRLSRVLLISPGPLMRMVSQWLAWFRPCFHPWQHDNHALIERLGQRFNRKSRGGD